MASIVNLEQFLIDVADAIRYREVSSAAIPAGEYDTRIKHLPSLTVLQYVKPAVSKGDNDTYGFTKGSDGYYAATNLGVNSSYSYATVYFTLATTQNVTFNCISYGENNYDFLVLSTLDAELTHNYSNTSTNVYKSFKGLASTSVQNVVYNNVPAGTHFITIKARKDPSSHTSGEMYKFKSSVIGSANITFDYRVFAFQHIDELNSFTEMRPNDLAVLYSQLDDCMLYQYKNGSWVELVDVVMTQAEFDRLDDLATLILTEKEVDPEDE